MTIEEKTFRRKRFVIERMEPFGFRKVENGFEYASDFMDGDFRAILTVSDKGEITGKVIDTMNNEEYTPLRAESFNGAYVNSVRAAYEKLLDFVAGNCCKDVLFASDQANRITEWILKRYSVNPDFPWEQSQYQSYGTFRHPENNKWFALIMNVKWNTLLKDGNMEPVDIVNLKAEPNQSGERGEKQGVYPGYHMNHKNWISVVLDERLTDEDVMRMVDTSFSLTK